jgi:hypothetical protein
MPDILKIFSALLELAKTVGNADLLKKIADLQVAIYELTDENRELKEKLRLVKFNKDNPLELRDGMYYASGENDPCCVRCYDVDGKRVHLTRWINFAHLHTYVCPQCKTEHRPDEYRSK